MSTRRVQSSVIKPRTLGAAAAVTPWVRNPSWLPLTAASDTDQRFRGLVAVFPQGAYLAFNVVGGTGYTVDWGDGTSENISSNTQANRLIAFSSLSADTSAPVSLTIATDRVGRTSHGYSNGMEVRFYNIVSTTGLVTAQTYYVINATANDFQVSLTVGGSAINLATSNGTATLLPYRQAIVNITPQSGQNITSLDLTRRNVTTGLQAYETGWLDIEVGSPNFTSLNLGGTNVRFAMCERAAVRSFGSVTNLSNLFNTFRKLQAVVIGNTASVTNVTSMFQGCTSLVEAPFFNTVAVTNMSSLFSGCASLLNVPLYNTAAVTNMGSAFFSCTSLVTVPLFNTAAVTSMASMFQNCTLLSAVPLFNTAAVTGMNNMLISCATLTTIPLLNTAAVQNMNNMFQACRELVTIPLLNTAAVTAMNNMFNTCPCLIGVPLLNTAAVTGMSNMFVNCSSLTTVPLFNTAAVTNMQQMFDGCSSLVTIPLFNTALNTNMVATFRNCTSLSSIPALNVSAVPSSGAFANMFQNCNSLSRIQAANFNYTFSVASCRLGATELDEIYTNLPTVTGQTITVSNNVGTTGDDPTIATAKGWTVTG